LRAEERQSDNSVRAEPGVYRAHLWAWWAWGQATISTSWILRDFEQNPVQEIFCTAYFRYRINRLEKAPKHHLLRAYLLLALQGVPKPCAEKLSDAPRGTFFSYVGKA